MWPALTLLLFACQEPFGADRHDLIGSRIAALTAEEVDGRVEPTLALILDGEPWSDDEVDIDWYWIEAEGDAADLVPGTFGVGRGPAPSMERAADRLAVLVSTPDTVLRAEVDVSNRSTSQPRIETARVDALHLDEVDADDMSLDHRRSVDATFAHWVEPGGFGRFRLQDTDAESTARFMATGDGTFFELDRTTTDWVAGTLVVDDEDIEERTTGTSGPITVIGLEIGEGRSGFAAAEFFVGEPPRGAWLNGRFVTTETPADGRMWAMLAPHDDSPTGLRLRDMIPAGPTDTWDASTLGCEGVDGPTFDPSWMLQHRCIRSTIVGQRVLIEVDP